MEIIKSKHIIQFLSFLFIDIFFMIPEKSLSMQKDDPSLSHTAHLNTQNPRINVVETEREFHNEQLRLLQNWLPIAATKVITKSEFIYARWAFSQIGQKEMAVSELIIPSQRVVTLAGIGILEATEDLVAEERGKYESALLRGDIVEASKHAQEIGHIFQSANMVGFVAGLPVIFGMRSIRPLMISYGYNTDLCNPLDDYYRVLSLGVPLRHLCFVSENFLISEGHVKSALLISSLSFFTSGLNYLFIRGPLKFENVVEGMAAASVIEATISIGGYVAIYCLNSDFHKYRIFRASINMDTLFKIVKRGYPIFIKRIFGALSPFILTQFIIPDRPEILSALALTTQIFLPSSIILSSIEKTINISIKRSMDKIITPKAYTNGIAGLMQSQIILGGFVFITYTYSDFIASLFVDMNNNKNLNMIENYRSIINLQLLNYCVSALGNTTSSTLRGVGQLANAMYSEVVTSWCISLPLSYYLVAYCDYGIKGTVIGPLAANLCNTIYLQYHWWSAGFGSCLIKEVKEFFVGSETKPNVIVRVNNYMTNWFWKTEKID